MGFLKHLLIISVILSRSAQEVASFLVKNSRVTSRTLPPLKNVLLLHQQQDDDHSYDEDPQQMLSRRRGRIRPNRPSSVTRQTESEAQQAIARRTELVKDPTLLSSTTFQQVVSDSQLQRALDDMLGVETMTEIQSKTFLPIARGKNLVGRARTGTGKTLAFLLPILERLKTQQQQQRRINCIPCLIVAPTRELVQQIASVAEQLLRYSSNMMVASCYGGTKMSRDLVMLNPKKQLPSILVATPGRLCDHIKSSKLVGTSQSFSNILRDTNILVLDEMDVLLAMGFQKSIQYILQYTARPEKRQLLLFSATLPRKTLLDQIHKGQEYVLVDCAQNDNDSSGTKREEATEFNSRVQQSYVILPSMDRYVSGLVEILLHIHKKNKKLVVFLPTARAVSFFVQYLEIVMPSWVKLFEMHSQRTQSARNRVSSEFSKSRSGILLTTNVSARGVDYPDVTHVIQYGSPDSGEIYIHRLGRTGRAGKEGEGLLVLMPFEKHFLTRKRKRKGDFVAENTDLQEIFEVPVAPQVAKLIEPVQRRISSGDITLTTSAQGAYRALLAYYVEHQDQWGLTANDIVQYANEFAASSGLRKIPSVSKKIADRLNLLNTPGIVIEQE